MARTGGRGGNAHFQALARLLFIPLLVAGLAGCLGPDAEPAAPAPEAPGEVTDDENVTVPEPVVFEGTAMIPQPAHNAHCFRRGVDGDRHALETTVDAWWFHVKPKDHFRVYWWTSEGYIEEGSGKASGVVPEGSEHAEVCRVSGVEIHMHYRLTIVHPDDPEHPEHGAGHERARH